MGSNNISKQLQELVSWSVSILGEAIKEEYGVSTFQKIESLRKEMKTIRGKSPTIVYNSLNTQLKKLEKYSDLEVHRICYSFSLMLELINRCESAYRSHRLGQQDSDISGVRPDRIIFVFTAHPTEARSQEFLELFKDVALILEQAITSKDSTVRDELFHALIISLKISLARNSKPTVADEASNIYSFILREDIIESLIKFSQKNVDVNFRSWVGGDKDGHPGVDEKTMLKSLNLSREQLIHFVDKKLKNIQKKILLLKHRSCLKLESQMEVTLQSLNSIKHIRAHDVVRVADFKKNLDKLCKLYEKAISIKAPELVQLEQLVWVFPALVVPLEVREDSEVVAAELKSELDFPISKMLKTLKEIADGFEAKWYVRGFVLSMVESGQDVLNGLKLAKKELGGYKIPVVPLFENEKALTNATEILETIFTKNKTIAKTHQAKWGNRYEVMVGYSDSSKENGVLPSRLMISQALKKIESKLKSYDLNPVFFHGSGGSIERGGGSLKEQTSWWPKSALNIFKSTIQGEMVARNFSNNKIFEKQVKVISEQLGAFKAGSLSKDKTLNKFSDAIRESYSSKIQDDSFLEVTSLATPYSFLHHLKIGSRPSKRSGGSIKNNLRAIPWILCWTQTRTLFPTWWGCGNAWKNLEVSERKHMVKIFKNHPVLVSYVKALGFTLAKIDLGVWKLYLEKSSLGKEEKEKIFSEFEKELKLTHKFFKEVTGEKSLLWFRPWLQHSIDLRSSMIHPINLCQIESLRRKDHDLLRTSVTGIACGMLTTG